MKAVRIALVVFALFAATAGAVVLADAFAPGAHACQSGNSGCL